MKAKHSLGQNFLFDQTILTKIKNSIHVANDNVIIEIGPGRGSLTKILKTYNVPLYAFEIDEDMHPYLDILEDNHTKIIYDDFLKINLYDYFNKSDNIIIVANIPYYITSPIINKLVDSNLNIKEMTLMVQDEVADRLSSNPGSKEYGYITAYLNYFYDIKKLFKVNKASFNPIPNVDSAIIQFVPIKRDACDINYLNNLLKAAFKFKRKNLNNNLKNYDLNIINSILNKYGNNLSSRAEDIDINIWIEIVNLLTKN